MSQVSPRMRRIAEQLIAREAKAGVNPASTFAACDTLRPHLATFMGSVGAQVLLSRALTMAGVEVRWLRALHVGADGSISAPNAATISPQELVDGRVAVLAHLLSLMVAFIGEALTLQLALDAWPKLTMNDLHRGDTK